jgi:FkbM family methyltransferase
MSMLQMPKRVFWWCLARLLSAGVGAIRRKPGPVTADEWRAVQVSYSQFGEDLVILTLLRERACDPNKGVYVDVGAYDPAQFSNTLLLRQHGWSGVSIDANPIRVDLVRRSRPNDVTVWAAVSNDMRPVRYLRYPTEGLNQIIEAGAAAGKNFLGEEPTQVDEVTTTPLTALLDRHLRAGSTIHFLNVDCEGQDLKVLESLDWARWRPLVVAAEANSPPERERLVRFMQDRGYTVAAQMLVTLIFVLEAAPAAGRLPPRPQLAGSNGEIG